MTFPDQEQHRALLRLTARRVWKDLRKEAVGEGEPPRPLLDAGDAGDTPGAAATELGCFVTWRNQDDRALRGCIGVTRSSGDTLAELAARMAVAAATRDPRFPAIPPRQLGELTMSVTLLGPEQSWVHPRDPAELVIGRHGLHVRRGFASGVLLPQVAGEWGYDGEQFLCATCRKANLDSDAWRDPAVEVFRFPGQELSGAMGDLLR